MIFVTVCKYRAYDEKKFAKWAMNGNNKISSADGNQVYI